MNRAAITRTIKRLKALPPAAFDMAHFLTSRPECGTVCCIAGHAILANGGYIDSTHGYFEHPKINGSSAHPLAAELLGIPFSREHSAKLFLPDTVGHWSPYEATIADAIAVLKHLHKTGEIDWSIAPSAIAANAETKIEEFI